MSKPQNKTIILKPIISEKTMHLADEFNQYTFKVAMNTGKIEVAKAISAKFDVTVTKVRIINVLGKHVRFGKNRLPGRKQNTKKAIVTLKSGDKLSVFEIK